MCVRPDLDKGCIKVAVMKSWRLSQPLSRLALQAWGKQDENFQMKIFFQFGL